MSWQYNQTTGEISQDGKHIGYGYSGYGRGLNDPDLQNIHNVGPIPVGHWFIGAPHDSKQTGPFTIILTPANDTQTFARTDFRIHGDNYHQDHSASHGCIITARATRELIWDSSDTDLYVISGREGDHAPTPNQSPYSD